MVRSLSALESAQSTSANILVPTPTSFKVNETPFSDSYEVGDELGSGQFAVVYKVTCRKTGAKLAAKFIKKRRYATSRRGVPRNHIEREIEVLRDVGGHENVIQLFDVFETPNDIILVLELVSGGELFDHVCAHEYLNEAEASAFIKQILLGIRHLHNRFVVHLDLKPENIMLLRRGEPRIKLIDFGLSRHIYPGIPVKDMIGTPEFVAPEVVNYEPLSPATDMWALGVVTYILLSGGSPFLGRTRDETFCNITSVNYHFSQTYFANTSQFAKDFIARLFVKDVCSRATVDEALNHPWIRGPDVGINDIRVGATINLSKIHGFKVKMRWRRALEIIRLCRAITRQAREEFKASKTMGYAIETKFDPDDLITSAILVACEEGNLAALEQLANVHRLSLLVANEHGETPIHIAAGNGFDSIVSFLYARGGQLGIPDRRGDTPIFWAARNGHANVIHLIGDKVDINIKNKNQETALHVATRYAQVTSAISLLEKGANIDVIDEHGETPLHIASWHGYTLLLSILCRFGPTLDLKNGPQQRRRSNLSSRASTVSECESLKLEETIERLEGVVERLTARDLDPSSAEEFENNNPFDEPLSDVEECCNNHESGDNNDDEEETDTFPDHIFLPSDHSNTSTVRVTDRSAGSTVSSGVVMASEEDFDYDQTKNPFSPYFRPSAKKPSQPNPFECSSFVTDAFQTPPIVPKLDLQEHFSTPARPSEALNGLTKTTNNPNPFRLEAWAAPSDAIAIGARDIQTARVEAWHQTSIDSDEEVDDEIYEITIKEGSHSAPNTQRKLAPCAVQYPQTEAFINLVMGDMHGFMEIESTAKYYPDGCFTDDETALHCASARGHIECVQCLVESGASVDSQDQNGQTALHLALRRSHIDIALYLISKECDMNIADANADTPVHIACRLGLNSVVQMLCHLGAEVDSVNNNGETPLHIAAKEGHIEIVRCLCFVGASTQAKNKDGLTPEIVAITKEQPLIAQLLAKIKNESARTDFVDQLCPAETPLRRIKLKIFGNSQSGKTRMIQALQGQGMIGNLINAVSRRFSDNSQTSPSKVASDEGIHSCASSSASTDSSDRHWPMSRPTHSSYTKGIDVMPITLSTGDEFSVWEFGGYEAYHVCYDHFVGNTDCIHIITIRADDATEIQYRQALYWMNFLKGRVTPSEPIGHRGIVARRSKVVIVATNSSPAVLSGCEKTSDGYYTNSDAEAMMKTIRLRFETHFDVFERLMFIESTNNNCPGLKMFKEYLKVTREELLGRLQRPLVLLDACITYLSSLRKRYHAFPVITWLHFTNLIRDEVNPLASDSHCQSLIHQLQLIGEVVYLRDETAEIDYVVITPEWLGTHIMGTLLSADFLAQCRESGCYSPDDFTSIFPEIAEPTDLTNILATLHLCSPLDASENDSNIVYEFPAFLFSEPPRDVWSKDKSNYVYGGMRILPMRGMESTLQSTFPRLQVAMRNQLHDYRDPCEVSLQQWQGISKLTSNKMEALVRLNGDAVEIQVRGPPKMAPSCIYFLEDIAGVIEQTTTEIAPGISLERHFLSPKHLREHVSNPASFPPETIMSMQQKESLSIVNSDGEEELFTDVVCFGSRAVAAMLTLGIDMSVSQLTLPSRCELASLLDPPDAMGRDWSILAVKLNLAETLPEVDSTGQSISQTDQLISEWSIKCPETATVGKFCAILEEMGRSDARDALYRTVPLYMFADVLHDEQQLGGQPIITSQRDTATSIADSGVLLSSAPRSSSTLSN